MMYALYFLIGWAILYIVWRMGFAAGKRKQKSQPRIITPLDRMAIDMESTDLAKKILPAGSKGDVIMHAARSIYDYAIRLIR